MHVVSEYMTRRPQTIGADQPLDVALAMMRALEIRHLPVLHEGRLVGVLSEHDLPDDSATSISAVRGRMSPGPYTVSADTSLAEVADMFAKCKFDVAVVLNREQGVLGVFTTVDLARALLNALPNDPKAPPASCNRWGHPIE